MARIDVGTSGYDYPEWKPSFYPADVSRKNFLRFYGTQFRSVELNNTFYQIPNESKISSWSASVPDNFRFVLKAPRRVTHSERLSLPSDALQYFIRTSMGLQQKLGAILFQLPPFFKCNNEKLTAFLEALPREIRVVFEFRHDSWFDPSTYQILQNYSAALCINDSDEKTTPIQLTTQFTYLRLRKSQYTPDGRREWQQRIQSWAAQGMEVFVFIKHEGNPEAPLIALEFQKGADS